MATMLLRIDGFGDEDPDRVESLLRELPGVFGVVVSPAAKCIEVDLEDDEVDYDRVLDRLRDAGYEAHLSG